MKTYKLEINEKQLEVITEALFGLYGDDLIRAKDKPYIKKLWINFYCKFHNSELKNEKRILKRLFK